MPPSLISRQAETADVEAFLDNVPARGGVLLIDGDAGMGKTALWHAGISSARDREFLVLESRSNQSETRIGLTAVGDLFGAVDGAALAAIPSVQRRAIESALLIGDDVAALPEPRLLGLALVSVLRHLSSEQPVLVAIDDAQWLDASSKEVLGFVLRRLGDLPVGALLTVRGHGEPFDLAHSSNELSRLTVSGLTVGAIYELLWERLELALPRPVLVQVHNTTGGNPFFALEIGRAIRDGSINVGSQGIPLPDSLQALVQGRVEALPKSVATTLVAVAALASPSVSLMESLGTETIANLERAAASDVLRMDGDQIHFTHPLLAPACYAALPLHRRRLVHRALADLDLDPEEKARHLALSASGPDEDIAQALDAAATRARRRGATMAAAELAEHALSLTPSTLTVAIWERRLTAARFSADAGHIARARDILEDFVATAPPGPVRADGLAMLADMRGRSEGTAMSVKLLERALAEPDLDSERKAMLLCALASASALDDATILLGYAETGLSLAEQLGNPATLVFCLTMVAELSFWITGSIRRDLLERAISLHQRSGESFRGDPRPVLAYNLGFVNAFGEARALWETLVAESSERADPECAVYLLDFAKMEISAGKWEHAAEVCQEAIELSRQTGREITELLCRTVLAEIDTWRGEADPVEILGLVRQTEPPFSNFGVSHRLGRALSALHLSRDEPEAAWNYLVGRFDGVLPMVPVEAQLAGSVGVETLIRLGDLRAAAQMLVQVDAIASAADTATPYFVHRCRAQLLAAQGDLEGAITEFETELLEPEPPTQHQPLERARTLLALGRVHRQMQHKKLARETLQAALASFEQLGARTWADQARGELRRIGGRTNSQEELSETEQRIVDLVVAGLKNREIAERLFLSPDTIAWNLSRVYRKFGVNSRTQLAAKLAQSPEVHAVAADENR